MDRNSSGNLDELAHLRRTRVPILGTQAIVIQLDCESASGVANETQLHAGGAAITANALKCGHSHLPKLRKRKSEIWGLYDLDEFPLFDRGQASRW